MSRRVAAASLALLVLFDGALRAAEFYDIDVSPHFNYASVSADGSVVITRDAIWTRENGLQALDDPTGQDSLSIQGVSGDGSVISGYVRVDDKPQLFLWTEETGLKLKGKLPGFDNSWPTNISGDGTTIIGYAIAGDWENRTHQAWQWTEDDGFTNMGLPQTIATGISADSSLIVGYANACTDDAYPFTWTESDGFEEIPLPEGWESGQALRVSLDGSTITGNDETCGAKGRVFRWTREEGTQVIPALPGSDKGYANGMNTDGSLITGNFLVEGVGDAAFVWDAVHGTRDLRDVLIAEHGFSDSDLPVLSWARFSADATVIAGVTVLGPGERSPWAIYLDKPLVEFGLIGDFDMDGALDADDIDLLSTHVLGQAPEARYDVDSSGVVDDADRIFWIEELANTIFGDADLDQDVDFADFLSLSNHFGGEGGWADGDFNGDGNVLFEDFLMLSQNFGRSTTSPDELASVPEPTTGLLLTSTIIAALTLRKRRTHRWHVA